MSKKRPNASVNRLHGRHGRGLGGGEYEKGMGKQFSPYPPSLRAMHLLAGGNFLYMLLYVGCSTIFEANI